MFPPIKSLPLPRNVRNADKSSTPYLSGHHRAHTKGDSILLVHARNFRGTFNGLVAGFLEPGETLEECVHREVAEETGLHIKNLKYFGSQPWPYPSGIMIGFTADYESGEIKLQAEELNAGAFYTKDNLPEIPGKLSLARKLIDDWLGENSQTDLG